MNDKYLNRLVGGALLLAGMVGATACSSDEDFSGTPGKVPSGQVVKTQFAISVPYVQNGKKLAGDIVQDNKQFRGIQGLTLIPHTAAINGSTVFSLGTRIIPGGGTIANDGLDKVGSSAKVYSDVEVPLQTSHFLVYAEALAGEGSAAKDCGVLTPSYLETPLTVSTSASSLTFSLSKIYGETGRPSAETGLLAVLNGIDDAFGTVVSGSELDELQKKFQQLKAASSPSILATVRHMYETLKGMGTESQFVITEIEKYFTPGTVDASGDSYPSFAWKSFQVSGTTYDFSGASAYPASMGLPDGAVYVNYKDGTFAYGADETLNSGMGATLGSYVYPPSLYYMANTGIKTDNNSKSDAYTTQTDWASLLGQYTTDNGVVKVSTRSVALKEQLQYAVGRFDLVPYFEGTIKDNSNEPNNVVMVGAQSFQLTGILIGGQKEQAAWDFQPVADAADKTIYDCSFGESPLYVTTTQPTTPVYSLALPTETLTQESGSVNFAIEMQNNSGEDFMGKDGVVPAGGKFYLLGTIDQSSKKADDASAATSVFASDYQTKVNAKITSLKNAYNVIPDLRTSRFELGLSVDLEWKKGIEFDITID